MARTIPRKKRARQQRRDNTTLIIVGVIAAVVVVALLVLLNINLKPGTPTITTASEGKTWGQTSAPVTIDMWSDYQ